MIKRPVLPLMLLTLASIFLFFLLNLLLGSVHIPLRSVWNILWGNTDESVIWQNIIWKSRVPQALTALVAGAGLVSQRSAGADGVPQSAGRAFGIGHQFRCQPGCGLCGILSGAMGGVALSVWVYGRGCLVGCRHYRCAGCDGAHCLCLPEGEGQRDAADNRCDDRLCGKCVIGVLKYFSVEEDIRAYVIWGLGSFARVSGDQMVLFVCIMAVLLPLSFLLIKTMNLLLLGDGYARNLGLNIKRARLLVISCSGVLVAIVTAYCGPIMFIGLAVPHLCRAIFHSSDHRVLMPATLLVGASLALVCNLIARMPGFEGALPVNSVTALVGAPVVASVLFRNGKEN